MTTDASFPSLYDTDEARWEAVRTRNVQADGQFVYAVRTTGVYCRPSSSARLPKRENVEFFASAQDAEAAGYRPIRRAQSDRTASATERTALIAQACRLIESAHTAPNLDELAAQAISWHKANAAFAPSCWATTPSGWCVIYRTNSPRQN